MRYEIILKPMVFIWLLWQPGADMLLEKPFSLEEFEKAINQVLK
jgi:hypothetical protein